MDDEDEEAKRYRLSRVNSGFSEREVIAYLVKKHARTEPKKANGAPVVSLANKWQPWIQWGLSKEPFSEYQKYYDESTKITERDMKRI